MNELRPDETYSKQWDGQPCSPRGFGVDPAGRSTRRPCGSSTSSKPSSLLYQDRHVAHPELPVARSGGSGDPLVPGRERNVVRERRLVSGVPRSVASAMLVSGIGLTLLKRIARLAPPGVVEGLPDTKNPQPSGYS